MHKDAIIVDKDDTIIGHKPWKEIDWNKDFIRASRLWLEDSVGNVLMQKRSEKMDFNAGLYVFAVGGVNDEGETYESAVRREALEEIGIELSNLEALGVVPLTEPVRKGFITYFRSTIPGVMPFIDFNPNEVADVKWFSKHELKMMMLQSPKLFVEDILKIPHRFGLL